MARILIVDDDESSRLLIGRYLEDGGHAIVFAPDGGEALERVRTQAFDAIVTDLAMPGVNGLRFIRAMKELGHAVPVIAISGRNADQLLLAEDFGAVAALQKPIDRVRLLASVEQAIAAAEATSNVWF